MVAVTLVDLAVEVGGREVLADCNATIADGAFVAIVGSSGSGKSSLLRAVAGLLKPARGRVEFAGVDVTSVEPAERDVGMMFQDPVIFPHRSVGRNVSFPLEVRRETIESIRSRVDAESRAMHIEHLLHRDPRHLSRGELQLVQIARTMVRVPRVFLLDEPFARLDEQLRQQTRSEVKMLQSGYGVTTIMATNDPDDVAAMATDVIVLGPDEPTVSGRNADRGPTHTIVQSGDRAAVADDPVSLAVARVMGPLWTFTATVERDTEGFWLTTPDEHGGLRYRAWRPALEHHVGQSITVGVRRGDLVVDERGELSAVVDRVIPGRPDPVVCRVGRRALQASPGSRPSESFSLNEGVRLRLHRVIAFDPATGSRVL